MEKGVGAFFAFLVSFLAASAYFGGGLAGIGVSVALGAVVSLGLLVLWPRVRRESQTVSAKISERSGSGKRARRPGPYAVVSGTPTKIDLNVGAGDRVDGYLEEVDGDFFDWHIVDEDNMVECLNGEDFDYIDGEENVHASKVNCRIPDGGPWYLMLDLGTRRYDRKVRVNLRVNRSC